MNLKEYWPEYLQSLLEFNQIAAAEQPEFDKMVYDVRASSEDFFLVSLSKLGCQRWEMMLGLTAADDDTLQARREKILIKYLGQLPYTYRALLRYLATVSDDYDVRLDHDRYTLYIRVTLGGYTQRDALWDALRQMLPANLVLQTQIAIPQTVQRSCVAAGAAMVTMVRHCHQPQPKGGMRRGTI